MGLPRTTGPRQRHAPRIRADRPAVVGVARFLLGLRPRLLVRLRLEPASNVGTHGGAPPSDDLHAWDDVPDAGLLRGLPAGDRVVADCVAAAVAGRPPVGPCRVGGDPASSGTALLHAVAMGCD